MDLNGHGDRGSRDISVAGVLLGQSRNTDGHAGMGIHSIQNATGDGGGGFNLNTHNIFGFHAGKARYIALPLRPIAGIHGDACEIRGTVGANHWGFIQIDRAQIPRGQTLNFTFAHQIKDAGHGP